MITTVNQSHTFFLKQRNFHHMLMQWIEYLIRFILLLFMCGARTTLWKIHLVGSMDLGVLVVRGCPIEFKIVPKAERNSLFKERRNLGHMG